MPTGTVISAVFHAAALVGLAPWFSRYSRPDEVAVFVSRHSVMSSSTSSFDVVSYRLVNVSVNAAGRFGAPETEPGPCGAEVALMALSFHKA
jgi:hypothetical protein